MKYENVLHEVLFCLAEVCAWAEDVNGDVSEGPVGWFAWIKIKEGDPQEIYPTLDEQHEFDLARRWAAEGDYSEAVGSWFIRETTDGTCFAFNYGTDEEGAKKQFNELSEIHDNYSREEVNG